MPTQGMRLSLNRMSVGGGETAASDRAAKTGTICVTGMRNDFFENAAKRSRTVSKSWRDASTPP